MNWKITEVVDISDIKLFLNMPASIYKNDSNWVRPLDKDIEAVFDSEKNKFFKTGICKRWLLWGKNNEVVGRVASFVSSKYKQDQPTGGIGFFECINNQEAANFMLDHCREWLTGQGMEAMDGPINFGERDRFWGMVVEGYFEPLYVMNYNPPYYKDLFENYGFQVYFYQECFGMKVTLDSLQPKFFERHKEIIQNHKNLSVQHLVKRDWVKYAKDFTKIYNQAWAAHGEGKTLEETVAIKMFKSMKPAMDERINWFVYEDDEPIACWINLPDLNHYFKRFKGKFGLLQKLQFLLLKSQNTNNKFIGIIFGVVPKWQGKGVDAFMIIEGTNYILKHSEYKDYEMQWIGDFNPKMISIAQSLGAKITRRLATYRYLFNRSIPFERHPIL